MKPRIGRKVYCIYDDGIFMDTAGYIGKDSFIVESVLDGTNEDSWRWFYDHYGVNWFTSLCKAKEELLRHFENCTGRKYKVVKVTDDWWQLEER